MQRASIMHLIAWRQSSVYMWEKASLYLAAMLAVGLCRKAQAVSSRAISVSNSKRNWAASSSGRKSVICGKMVRYSETRAGSQGDFCAARASARILCSRARLVGIWTICGNCLRAEQVRLRFRYEQVRLTGAGHEFTARKRRIMRIMHQCTHRRELCMELSPIGKSGPVCLVDPRHLLDGEGEAIGDRGHMVYFVKR